MRIAAMFTAAFLVVVQGIGPGVVNNTLKCYQCVAASNEQCTDEAHLKLCPNDQAYDRCMTTITADPESGVVIRKKCVLGLCSLQDSQASTVLGLDKQCDRTKPRYYCTSCCHEDGCNKNFAVTHVIAIRTYTSLVVSVTLHAVINHFYLKSSM